tara:strand:- start:892 stop:1908 length:1017 start_codon:yes stop_codon:yes gene_type:complete
MEKIIDHGEVKAQLLYGYDVLEGLSLLDDESVDCIVTSPPYWGLRNYEDNDRQIGSESSPEDFVATLVDAFSAARRVLRSGGTLWLNLGDTYAGKAGGYNPKYEKPEVQEQSSGMMGSGGKKYREKRDWTPHETLKPKDLCGIPWRVALALQADGWWLRNDIIWQKPSPMPSPAQDRCTVAHEYIFLLTKSSSYNFYPDAVRTPLAEATLADPRRHLRKTKKERYGGDASCPSGFTGANPNGANIRTVWKLKPNSYQGDHFAVFPEELPERCIKAGTQPGDTVLDLFSGSATTGKAALRLGRNYIGVDVNESYLDMAARRVSLIHSDVVKDEDQLEMF